jgi:phosphatidylglycerophosphate synthase
LRRRGLLPRKTAGHCRGPPRLAMTSLTRASSRSMPISAVMVAKCYSVRSGGFLYSRTVCDRLGSVVAAMGMRVGAHPTYLTLLNLFLGVGGSAAVLVGSPNRTALLVSGVVLWQVAYLFDCADGQLARVTGQASTFGAAIDVLVDVAVQISVVVAVSGAILARREIPNLLVVLFASSWFVNFVTYLLAKNANDGSHSLSLNASTPMSVAKLLRDYGFVLLLFGVWLLVWPTTLFVPAMAVTGSNLVVLVGHIVRDGARSVSCDRQSPADAKGLVPELTVVGEMLDRVESRPRRYARR